MAAEMGVSIIRRLNRMGVLSCVDRKGITAHRGGKDIQGQE